MGAGYTRQSDPEIEDGLVIEASSLDNEFDAIQTAFNGTTGHSHDGSVGEGPKISLTTSITGVLPAINGGTGGINKLNATTAPTVNEDANDDYAVGSVWIDTTNDVYYVCLDSTVGSAIWRRFQPYDVDLSAIAALSSAADKLAYATGSGTWALSDFTSFGRSLVDDADASAARSTLGVVIGTNVQAYDVELQALSGVTSAADTLPYFTGLGTAGITTFTSAGRALVDDATASDQLTTLGVSTYIKTLLDDADASAARTTLGIDTSAFQAADATLTALAAYNTNGILTQTSADTFTGRTITGTANEITATNGNGVSGNPTLSLPSALTFTGKTITGGTFGSGTWSSGAITTSSATITGGSITGITDLTIADGGTGASTAATGFDNLKQQATTSYSGVSEFATAAEFRTGTSTVRSLVVDQVWASAAEVTLTDAATIAVDMSTFLNAVVTLGGNRTLGNPSNPKVGQSGVIRIVQDGTGSRTLAYSSFWKFPSAIAPTLSTGAGSVDLLFYQVITSTFIFGNLVKGVA